MDIDVAALGFSNDYSAADTSFFMDLRYITECVRLSQSRRMLDPICAPCAEAIRGTYILG